MYGARTLEGENDNQKSSELEMTKTNNGHDYKDATEEIRETEHPYQVLKQDGPATNTCQLLQGIHMKALIFLLITTNIIAITALIICISSVSQSSGKVDGNWSVWTTWTACDVTCGNGSQTRFRMCSNPAPAGNGQQCVGNWFELTACRLASCSVDGGWSGWSTWTKCYVTCGNGTQTRIRTCTDPTPLGGGLNCSEDWNEMKVCRQKPCNEQGSGTVVAFTAYGNTVVNSSFVFPFIIINYGKGYNNSTGQFICKVAGIYYFAVHVGKTLYSFARSVSCSLYLNSVVQLSAAEVPYPNDINNRNGLALSLSGTFYLKENDTVSVGCSGVNLDDRSCSFTGFLVTGN